MMQLKAQVGNDKHEFAFKHSINFLLYFNYSHGPNRKTNARVNVFFLFWYRHDNELYEENRLW